jgi:hypothetical protein
LARRLAPVAVLLALAAVASGCGGTAGVSSGATVTVYVSAPLCPAAKRELAASGGRAGDVRIRAICLGGTAGKPPNLAATGADARRATEDSTTIAYLEAPGPAARFAQPIVESAGIAWVKSSSGSRAMARILHAVSEADSSALRDSVRGALE